MTLFDATPTPAERRAQTLWLWIARASFAASIAICVLLAL